ncbi:MAG: HAMP domain-containing protein [Deltaproteobacteria bacterium]|nr:HAMP domain-containing protein [Deltaproteobacteria bacterium]
MSAAFKRKTFLVKKGLQFRYMGVIIIAMLAVAMVVGFTIYFTIWDNISDPGQSLSSINNIFERTNTKLCYSIVALIIFIAAASIFVSHKIAGPVYRFEQSVKKIAQGDLTLRIKLRKGDELTELADMFNNMVESLEKMVSIERVHAEKMGKALEKLRNNSDKKEVEDILTSLTRDIETLNTQFKITGFEDKSADSALEFEDKRADSALENES